MKSNYQECLTRVLKDEGGYTNDAADPGGPTNFGITIGDYRHYIKSDATAGDVRQMKLEDAKTIYQSKYWDAMRCSDLPSGVDYVVFDYGVNSGIFRSAKVLQRLAGVTQDGVIGPETLTAVAKMDVKKLINDLCDERLAFLRGLKTFGTFGKGWTTRVSGVRKFSLSIVDRKPDPVKSIPSEHTAAGAIVTGGAIAATQVGTAHPHTLAWVILGSVVVAGVIWALIRHYKNKVNTNVV